MMKKEQRSKREPPPEPDHTLLASTITGGPPARPICFPSSVSRQVSPARVHQAYGPTWERDGVSMPGMNTASIY